MGRLLWLAAALSAVGCGKVGAEIPDARVDALADALVCTTPMIACAGSCTDPMSDGANCGSCGNACQAAGETCTAGHCVDAVADCATIHQLNSAAMTGFYTLHDATQIYCEMTHPNVTYQELGMGEFDLTYAGYDLISFSDLADAAMQQTFIALYNHQGGTRTIAGYTSSGNCCVKQDASANMLGLGGMYITPATAPSTIVCDAYTPGTSYAMALSESSTMIQGAPLPTTFFTAHPAAAVAACSTATNPAFFWKRH